MAGQAARAITQFQKGTGDMAGGLGQALPSPTVKDHFGRRLESDRSCLAQMPGNFIGLGQVWDRCPPCSSKI